MAIRVHRQIDDAQINAQQALRHHRRFFRCLQRQQQIKNAIDQHQIGLALGPMELDALVVPHLYRDHCTTMQGSQAGGFEALKRQNPLVIDDGAISPKADPLGRIALLGFHDFGNGTDGQLCGQTKALADLVVDECFCN